LMSFMLHLQSFQNGAISYFDGYGTRPTSSCLKALCRRSAEHPIEEVGARLRAMMPWIAKNKLVDKTKNWARAVFPRPSHVSFPLSRERQPGPHFRLPHEGRRGNLTRGYE